MGIASASNDRASTGAGSSSYMHFCRLRKVLPSVRSCSELETASRNKQFTPAGGRDPVRLSERVACPDLWTKFALAKIESARQPRLVFQIAVNSEQIRVRVARLQPLDRLDVPDEASILVETSYDSHLCPCKLQQPVLVEN